MTNTEKTVPAPTSDTRITFEGVVVSAKIHEGRFGTSYKMTVKVTTPDGVWLAWGTAPTSILESVPNAGGRGRLENLRGALVQVTARLKPGRDRHFAITNRPVGKVLEQGPLAQLGEVEDVGARTQADERRFESGPSLVRNVDYVDRFGDEG